MFSWLPHHFQSHPPIVHLNLGISFDILHSEYLNIPSASAPLQEWNWHQWDIYSFQAKVLENFTHLDRTLRGHCFSGRLDEAVRLVCGSGTQVHPETYSLLLQECIFRKQFRLGRRIHAQMAVVGFVPNVYLITKLLILYAKAGDLETASILFNELPETS